MLCGKLAQKPENGRSIKVGRRPIWTRVDPALPGDRPGCWPTENTERHPLQPNGRAGSAEAAASSTGTAPATDTRQPVAPTLQAESHGSCAARRPPRMLADRKHRAAPAPAQWEGGAGRSGGEFRRHGASHGHTPTGGADAPGQVARICDMRLYFGLLAASGGPGCCPKLSRRAVKTTQNPAKPCSLPEKAAAHCRVRRLIQRSLCLLDWISV